VSVDEGAFNCKLKFPFTKNSEVSPPQSGLIEKFPSEKSSLS
jgi:hypothetical protein